MSEYINAGQSLGVYTQSDTSGIVRQIVNNPRGLLTIA